MRILVDADACPVMEQVESVARWHNVPVTLVCDTNHELKSDYSEVVVVGDGADAVDFALVRLCQAGDVVVTQDYGVAAMALSRKAYAIHQDGWQYTNENIDGLLTGRHKNFPGSQAAGQSHFREHHKRTEDDNDNFVECLDRLLGEAQEAET